MAVRFLTAALVLAIHDDQARLYGGSYGERDEAGLDAAVNMPLAQYGGRFLHATIYDMGAAYGFHLSQNRPFVDGNKRTAGMAMLTFLKLNGLEPVVPEMECYDTMMAIASGRMGKAELAAWLRTAERGTPPEVEENGE